MSQFIDLVCNFSGLIISTSDTYQVLFGLSIVFYFLSISNKNFANEVNTNYGILDIQFPFLSST